MQSINVLSKKDVQEMIEKEFEKLRKQIYQELNKIRNKILDLEQLIKYFKT